MTFLGIGPFTLIFCLLTRQYKSKIKEYFHDIHVLRFLAVLQNHSVNLVMLISSSSFSFSFLPRFSPAFVVSDRRSSKEEELTDIAAHNMTLKTI
jgi:hypothetical protein